MTDNKSFVLRAINQVAFEEYPIPNIGPDDALVQVKKTGICGSDVHYLVDGRIGDFVVRKPMVLGHESSGIVFKVGANVKNLAPGDRVSMEPGETCRICEACKSGKYNLCPDVIFAATPPYDGTLCRYYKLPGDLCYKLPDNLTLEDGSLIEPLSAAVHAIYTVAQMRTNQSVAIFGCGPIGLCCMAVAKALGASRIIAIDIVVSRAKFARDYVATDTFIPPSTKEGESKMEYSRRATALMMSQLGIEERGPQGIDLVVDASGADVCIQMGILLTKIGGTYVQLGAGKDEVVVPMTLFFIKELTVKGSFRYGPGDYAMSIALVSQGKIDLKPLVTHRFAFEEAALAFETTRKQKSEDGKGVIKAIISGPGVSTADV